jgi:hypothetical protein
MFIYVIVNRATLKLYVGQHKGDSLRKYLQTKLSDAAHQRNGHSRLFASMRKHSKEMWSIYPLLSDLQTREECNYWERFYIRELKSQHPDVGYNICRGGEGHTGPLSEETKRKLSEKSKAAWAGMPAEEKQAARDRVHSWWAQMPEGERQVFCEARAKGLKGQKRSAEFCEMRRRMQTGVKPSPETIAKRVISLKNQSAESRARHAAAVKRRWESGAMDAFVEARRGVPRPPEVIAAMHTPEAVGKSAATRTGMHLSPEHCAGISERKKKWWARHRHHEFPAARNARISAAMKGRKLSAETIAKIKATKALQRQLVTV